MRNNRGIEQRHVSVMITLSIVAAALAMLPSVLRAAAPLLLAAAEVLLGVGHACVTFLRTGEL